MNKRKLSYLSDEELRKDSEKLTGFRIGEKYGCRRNTVYRELKRRKIKKSYILEDSAEREEKALRRKRQVEDLILEGRKREEIETIMGSNGKRLRGIINYFGLTDVYNEIRELYEEENSKERQLSEITGLLGVLAEEKSEGEPIDTRHIKYATKYYNSLKIHKTSITTLFSFFKKYCELIDRKEKMSVWDFCEGLEVSGTKVNRILDGVRLKTIGRWRKNVKRKS